jgi:hypothetical protein
MRESESVTRVVWVVEPGVANDCAAGLVDCTGLDARARASNPGCEPLGDDSEISR